MNRTVWPGWFFDYAAGTARLLFRIFGSEEKIMRILVLLCVDLFNGGGEKNDQLAGTKPLEDDISVINPCIMF